MQKTDKAGTITISRNVPIIILSGKRIITSAGIRPIKNSWKVVLRFENASLNELLKIFLVLFLKYAITGKKYMEPANKRIKIKNISHKIPDISEPVKK